MTTPTGSLKSALFRATTDGRWIFRSPNPWVFGDTPHYLINDAQKRQIEAIITPKRPTVVVALFALGVIAWAALVATFLWAFSGHPDPTPGDTVLMIFLILVPAFAVLPLVGVIKRRRLAPVLEGAELTSERISFAELRNNARAASTLKQSLNALVASLFAFFAALFALVVHLVTKHFAFDSQVALWIFVAVAFGFASASWYLQVLSKAAALEGTQEGR